MQAAVDGPLLGDTAADESDDAPDMWEAVEERWFQHFHCPPVPPRGDCHLMQWWVRWLTPFIGTPAPTRWAVAAMERRRLGN